MTSTYTTEHEQQAYELGCEHARNAASWVIDANTIGYGPGSSEHMAHVLQLMDDGDPRADEYLPARPNLSGEWADAPTPRSLAWDILAPSDPDNIPAEIEDAIADAYETGVMDTFMPECERILREAIS